MHRGIGLVGETPDQLEWTMSDFTKTITSDGDRCIDHRLGSYMAVKCFTRDKEDIMILLRMDSTTAIAYINKLGGTVSQN